MQCGIAKNFYFWIQFFSKLSRTLCDDDLGCGQCNRESDVKAIGFWIEGDFLLCHISRIIMMIMMTLRSMKTFIGENSELQCNIFGCSTNDIWLSLGTLKWPMLWFGEPETRQS